MSDSCLQRKPSGQTKVAASSGITIFLLEELGDARLRCAQLKKYVDEAVKLIEKSGEREHFFEVAAHLIHGIPDTLLRMDKALTAAAMAAAKMDYEDNKDDLRPEKVEELEKALEEVRVRRVQRRSKAKQAVESAMKNRYDMKYALDTTVADDTKESRYEEGKPADPTENMDEADAKKWKSNTDEYGDKFKAATYRQAKLMSRQEKILKDYLASAGSRAAMDYDDLPSSVRDALTRVKDQETLWSDVNRWLGDNNNPHLRSASDEHLSRYEEGKPADPTENMDEDDAKKWKSNTDEYGDKFKSASMARFAGLERTIKKVLDSKFDSGTDFWFENGLRVDPAKAKAIIKALNDSGEFTSDAAMGGKDTVEFKTAASSYGGDPRWIHAKYPGKSRDGTPFKKGELVLYWPSDKSFDVGDKAETAWQRFESEVEDEDIYNNSRMANTLADQLIESRYEEGKPADPTENMDEDDAKKWKSNTDEYGDKFKSASFGRYASTLADQLIESRYEEGKPADPTENMDADDAKEWDQNTEEYGDKFKTAAAGPSPSGSNWKEIRNLRSHTMPVQAWAWDDGETTFVVREFEGPGIPLYSLKMSTELAGQSGFFKSRRPAQFKRPEEAFKFAANWYKMIASFESGSGIGLDLTNDWTKI